MQNIIIVCFDIVPLWIIVIIRSFDNHYYPEDETANLNAACAEIERGDYKAASRYLAKAGNSPYAAHARGVMAMKQGNDDEARRQFTIAAQGGVKEAQQNLDIMGN